MIKDKVHATTWSMYLYASSWKQYSAALTHFSNSSSEDVCVFLESSISWVAGDVKENAKFAKDNETVSGAVIAQKAFGGGWTSHWRDEQEINKGQGIPIGTHDNRGHDVDHLDWSFLAIEKSIPSILWEQLNVDGDIFKSELHAAMAKRDMKRVIYLSSLGISETTLSSDETFVDFFRPAVRLRSDGQWAHLEGDFSFAERCIYCGIRPQINSRPVVTSWGRHGYTFQDATFKLDRTTGPKEG